MGRMATRTTSRQRSVHSATVSGRKRPLKSGGAAQRKKVRSTASSSASTLLRRANPKASRKKVNKANAADAPTGSTSALSKRKRHWVCFYFYFPFSFFFLYFNEVIFRSAADNLIRPLACYHRMNNGSN